MAIYSFEEKKPKKTGNDYQKISGIICVAVAVLALFCLITHFVPFVKSFLLGAFGLFCYPFFITLLAIGFALIGHKKYVMPRKYIMFLGISIILVLCIFQLILVNNDGLTFWEYIGKCYTQKTTAGGVVISLLTAPVLYILNKLGAYVVFVALAVIFIALTCDYIHHLSKNEGLKKAILLAKEKEPAKDVRTTNITVKELENNLKKQQNKVELKEEKEKVKLTLDAKVPQENPEEAARRKLGLLASSKQDEEDNSRYFATEVKKEQITNPKEYILSGYKSNEVKKENKLTRIQENLMEIKSRSNISSYVIPNTQKATNIVFNQSTFEDYKKETIKVPESIIHENPQTSLFSRDGIITTKSTISQRSSIADPSEIKPKLTINDDFVSFGKDEEINLKNDNRANIQTSNEDVVEEAFSARNADDDKTPKVSILDVEDFSNSVLASLKNESFGTIEKSISKPIYDSIESENKENKSAPFVNAVTPSNMFVENEPIIEPILPKKQVNYVKPPIELLTTESMDLSLVNQEVIMKREELEMALDTFGIPAKVIGVVIGPAVTRYELEMPAGVSIKRLLALQDDIAYNLSSNGDIRIEAPIPGRRAVGIEVPNEKIATVGLKDIIMSREFMESKSSLAIALGKDISGMIKTFSLVKIPHLLIAGTTGSGKSVCINAIILSLIYKYSPDEVKFILIDPKRVEFSMYNHLPHLIMPNVITDSEKALNALSWCVDEMERRFITFANARAKNLEEYNESEEVLEGRAEKLPYIIFIIDELADLLMTAKKEAEEHICRILQKARAAGIHMILATQRPSVDVVTGKIKANLNARICFALMTAADSKTVLDQGGADKLLGRGDMLFMSSDTGVPKRIQGCYVTTKEIDDVVTFVKENNGDYDFDIKTEQAIINPPKNDVITQIDGDKASSDGFDALMPQVLKSIIESGHASISMIQRKFLVGFPRAARIIDQMEQAGYISPSDGSKSRSVYITMEEYEELYGGE